MAVKTGYYYKVSVMEKATDRELVYRSELLKSEVVRIVNEKSSINGAYRTIDITLENEDMHTTMDVCSYTNDIFFCRISRQRPNNTLLKRNYDTMKDDAVFTEEEANREGIEMFTFFMLKYNSGILSIVSALGAPTEKVFINLFSKYSDNYYVQLQDIPNRNAINAIYLGEKPEISKIEFDIPVPSGEIMQQLLGWDRDDVTDTIMENSLRTKVVIKGPDRAEIVKDEDAVKAIDKLKEIMDNCRSLKVTGKAKDVKAKEYDLAGEFFGYKIDIPTYEIRESIKYYFSIGDLTAKYRENMLVEFNSNNEMLCAICGRNINEQNI